MFRHVDEDVRILTRGAASALDRASAERPEVASRVARQLFGRLRSESERRATLLAMTDLGRFDAHRCSTAALQHNVLERIARKRDLLVLHDRKEQAEHCCPSARSALPAATEARTAPPSALGGAARERHEPTAKSASISVAISRLPRETGAVVASPSWGGDSSKWSFDQKLQSMHRSLRPKVSAVMDGLSRRGFQPKIFFAWRSVAVQLDLVARGRSKVKFSFHNAQLADGTPNAYAADIIDARYGWSNQAMGTGFWRALGEEAHAQNLHWGGDWKTFRDWAHVQLVDNSLLSRVRKESGF